MRVHLLALTAMVAATMSGAALADDPNDPAMRSAAARARDRETIRQLNLQQLAMVRERDAQYAKGWQAYRAKGHSAEGNAEFHSRSQDYELARADYEHNRAQYEREMAEWRRAVAECRQGNYVACDN